MKVLADLLIVILQLIVGSLLGFAGAIVLGVGNGWELVVFALGYTLGVWGTGVLASCLRKASLGNSQWVRLGTTLVVSFLGVLLLLVTPAMGFIKTIYPLVGAILGYYLPALFKQQPSLDRP